ncbi:MraY family glycosyltransferase [Streptomyces sp. NPDC051041]|uniref:MraY family glycosyltransferase n=1 Tax=Streptomyces sp. NPDC051041 TaxID=3365640 RepID=UPI0037BC5B3C
MLYGIVAAATAVLLTALLTALLRPLALRLGVVEPRGRGRSEEARSRPLPLLGGVAVVLGTSLVAGAGQWTGAAPLGAEAGRLLAAGAGVALLGLAADAWRLRRRFVLAGTAVAAALVVPYGETGVPGGVLAAGWIVCVAAAFRGLDHSDGLAGTAGVVTAFGVAVCAAVDMLDGVVALLSTLAAALAGFLLHNWHPARSALGACGSLFAGFVLASAAVFARAGREPSAGAAVLFALTSLAIADAVLVVLSRWLAGRALSRGGPDHLAHRLRRLGLTARGATVLLGVGAVPGVLTGVLVHTGWAGGGAALWIAAGALVVVLGLLRVRVYEPRRTTGGGAGRVPRSGGVAARQGSGAAGGGAGRVPRSGGVAARQGSGAAGAVARPGPRTAGFPVRQVSRSASSQARNQLRVRSG